MSNLPKKISKTDTKLTKAQPNALEPLSVKELAKEWELDEATFDVQLAPRRKVSVRLGGRVAHKVVFVGGLGLLFGLAWLNASLEAYCSAVGMVGLYVVTRKHDVQTSTKGDESPP